MEAIQSFATYMRQLIQKRLFQEVCKSGEACLAESLYLPPKLLDMSRESPITSPDGPKTNIDRRNGRLKPNVSRRED
ncbi:hypothetical protein CDAR_560391 [Caerostris darwini]|uniref:Uncharacterized protein n=1 Tax=Caerostris darwini TaxID=1538125 RepID=A0AAV4W187_9ARAC|nr:hypothetical protein CDAR_560131 [Caerostris darwini]GIY75676.1 hypothetical protein CDAR_560391 [Caerostris darwini]